MGVVLRAKPAVGVLVGEDVLDPTPGLGQQAGVAEQHGQRQHAVQPVWSALPTLGFAAQPTALRDVRPELVQVAAQSSGLHAELFEQPATRGHLPERQGSEGRRVEGRGGGHVREGRIASYGGGPMRHVP